MTVFFDQKNKKKPSTMVFIPLWNHHEELLLVRMENARGYNVIFIT